MERGAWKTLGVAVLLGLNRVTPGRDDGGGPDGTAGTSSSVCGCGGSPEPC